MSKKWNCPTCGAPNIPKGMHCRSCICDILSGTPIGTTARLFKEKRKAQRDKSRPIKMLLYTDLYEC